jgi:hypothetical protein
MEDIKFNALFHVIDAKTTYNMLLGQPWIHEIGIISSTLHQCFNYCQDGATNSSPNRMVLMRSKKSTPTELIKLSMRMD